MSSVTPRPPCTWMARSRTSCSTFAPKNLMSEMSTRAAFAPAWSMRQAACRVRSRAASISAALSAIQFCTVCFSASGPPKAVRVFA